MAVPASHTKPRAQLYSIEDIKDMLAAQIDQVVSRYAPEASGCYIDKHLYFTLNPGRADNSVGSFCVHLSGPRVGYWNDYATGQRGDVIDLIANYLGCTVTDALREARAFLGLQSDSPEDRRAREAAADLARRRRLDAEARQADTRARVRRQAAAIFLSASADLTGTPVAAYLAGRGIDLTALPRMPRAIRYLSDCFYKNIDAATGEVIECRLPAMVAAVTDRAGEICALHRTYLGLDANGRWGKASVPQAKKVLGDYRAAAIRLWSGLGPRGGHPGALATMPKGSRVYICEGIEDGLSAALIKPEARILAAISLSNLGAVALPGNIGEITMIADLDENEQARAALTRAIETHRKAGRVVRVWQNRRGGKDLNDALRAGGAVDLDGMTACRCKGGRRFDAG